MNLLLNLGKFLLGLMIFGVWMLFARSYYFCQVKGNCEQELLQHDSLRLAELPQNLEVQADGFVVFEAYPQFYFDHGSTLPIYGRRHLHLLEGIADKLKSQPQARLKIEAFFLGNEAEAHLGPYKNLGVARAMAIADKLIYEYQVNPQQLMTLGKLKRDSSLAAPIHLELMGYRPTGTAAMEREVANFAQQFEQSVLRVTYDARMAFLRDPEARFKLAPPVFNEYLDSLKAFIANKDYIKILLIGHTDSKLKGKAAEKEALAFANSMKKYLTQKGITHNIRVETKGNDEKLEEDLMPDGNLNTYTAAKNRRVEILLVDVQ